MLIVNNISKVYGSKKGINKLSLQIESGSIICFVGPNGAGKTTALKIIAGIMQPDTGCCTINEMKTNCSETKKHIGYLAENSFIYPQLTVNQYIGFVSTIKCVLIDKIEMERLLKIFDLWEKKDVLIKELSMGMKKKVNTIIALMGCPPLIILDEPTNALDTKGIISLKDEINKASEKGSIVVISSHILDFVKQIGTMFIFLRDGNVINEINKDEGLDLDNIYRELYIIPSLTHES